MSGVVKCGGKAFLAAVVATLMVMACPVSAATFTPTDVAALIAAINAANANGQGDTIDLGGQTFVLMAVDNVTEGPNGLPVVLPDGGEGLTIRNGTIERSPTASGFRFLWVSAGAMLALESLTLRGGHAEPGISIAQGGAVFNLGTLSIVDSTFSNNSAYPGQSGAIQNNGVLSLAASSFSGNFSSFAGAVGNSGTLSITGCTFAQNGTEFDGGAIFNAATVSAIWNSTFSANTAARSGAIYNQGLIVTITNATFALNSADFSGIFGGIHNEAEAEIRELASSIFALSDSGTGLDLSNDGVIGSASNNLIGAGDRSGLTNGVNGNQVGSLASPLDPLLGPLADNGGPTFTHALLAGGPAIDAGSNPAALANDQRGPGFSRVSGAQADVGAFELQSADLSVAKVDAPDPVIAGANLTWTVTVSNAGPDAATTVALVDALPSGTTFVSLAAPGGWSCAVPAVGTTGAVSCSTASMPVGSAAFAIVATVAGATLPGTVLSNTATVNSVTPDPDSADTSASATTTVISPAILSATKTVAGNLVPGGNVIYTIVLANTGAGAQVDNPGDELVDVLPAELALVSATATSGTALATTGTNTVTWNGSIPSGGTVTITIGATVRATTPLGTSVSNQAMIAYDLDGNGTNEASAVSNDPATPAAGDATDFIVLAADVAAVPVLDAVGLGLLALLVALGGALVLGRRLS